MTEVNLTERPEDTLRRYAGILVKIRRIHQPKHLYNECGHAHTGQDIADGTAVNCGDLVSCADGYLHSICAHCCLDGDGDQREECADYHEHGRDKPICSTSEALKGS